MEGVLLNRESSSNGFVGWRAGAVLFKALSLGALSFRNGAAGKLGFYATGRGRLVFVGNLEWLGGSG